MALGAALTVSALALSACSFTGEDKAEGAQVLTLAVGSPIDSLDPHYINNGAYVVPSGLLEGLVAQNDAGDDVVPAIASEWTLSDDGLDYTFTIRDEAKFSNGDPITADAVVANYERLLTPTGAGGGGTAGANSYQIGLGIKGATGFQAGAITDWEEVGIKSKDDKTVVFTLDAPNADFLMGLTDYSMLITDAEAIEANPQDWTQPKNWVGSGAFTLKTWDPTTGMVLVPNEHYWDKGSVKLDQIDIRVIADPQAALLAYQNDDVDITLGMPDLIGTDEKLEAQLQVAEGYAISYLNIQYSENPAQQDERVRQALSYAIDRDKLAGVQAGTTAASSLVPERVPGWTESMATSTYDPEKAKQLLADAGYPDGEGLPAVQLFDHRPRPISDAIVDMWKQIGVDAEVNIVDLGVFAETRWNVLPADKMGFYMGNFGGIPTMNNWVYTFWGPDSTQRFSLPGAAWQQYQAVQADESLDGAAKSQQLATILSENASEGALEFSEIADRARATVDREEQTKLFVEAATLRESLGLQVPVLEEGQSFLVKPKVSGVHVRTTMEGFYYKGITIK